jgi:DMSO reductase family type II enzyme heme b subunit
MISRIGTLFGQNPRLRVGALLAGLMAVGSVFSLADVSLVRAATSGITAALVAQTLPEADPFSPLWSQSPQMVVPISAQQMWQPGGGGSVHEVRVRALHNGKRVAFLLNWDDEQATDYVKDKSSDAIAIQLPIDPARLPYQCMGQSNNRVNIWQWKAQFQQQALDTGAAEKGARNLTSNGICRAVDTPGISPVATGVWRNGQWNVVFARDMGGGDPGSALLAPGTPSNAAFAVWNGDKGETRGMKGVSTWTPLEMVEQKSDTVGVNLGLVVISAALGAGIVALAWRLIPH